ncbi:zinc finger protein 92-like [Pseudomyrmex gracilis]|uniref:zinc finger protein 92-like n=1 Tax=Pseudomyrmex gracilis TaxID=219809 RepID=UPI000995AFF0|nr:zinc finger protein 92-like [Pseudomyrmex gracilis]
MSNMFACAICKQQKFQSFGHLVFHHKTKHSGTSCKICDAVCENKATLLWHYTTYHKKNNTYVCNKCVFTSSLLYLLKKHAIYNHSYVVKFCWACNNHFFTLHEYKVHQNVHKSMTSNMFKCSICNPEREYISFHELIDHHKKQHFKKPCDMSDNIYKEKEKLDEHRSVFLERSNTYDEEKMEVDDHQVGYSVHQNTYEEDKEKLDKHQSVQSAWPYTCAICDEEYNFFVSHVLPVHSSVALQHDCSICTSAYVKFRNRKSNLSSICDKKKEEDV